MKTPTQRTHPKSLQALLAPFACALVLSACGFEPPKAPTLTSGITGLNHTDTYIATFYVNGAWGGNISAGGGGGKTTCCVELPSTFRPGLVATVKWNATNTIDPHWYEQTVPVDPYGPDGGRLYVHFLPDGKVQLVVSNFAPSHPDYQGPGLPSGYKGQRDTRRPSLILDPRNR